MVAPKGVRPEQMDEEDQELDDFFGSLLKANMKESFDIHRGDDRSITRILLSEYLRDRKVERERQAADAEQTRRHAEELFHLRVKQSEEEYSERRRQTNLASAQQWRDQARDSGESVFDPKQSS